eukprot:CAMPEP_0197025466 /NCGR_PEP_ID=MMETSP1384-20130603/5795_1 /TAXON_ID=29189 /ORGANISM="Ammonia sp." /LENGTH=261 /DNA_ID=CAMNT_0042453997 /DNA_START=28 /DNA_END=810 /DNA_ORIENTATION=+
MAALESKPNDECPHVRKTLYCIRHAQSEYNETMRTAKTWFTASFWYNWFDPKLHDPVLSTHGKQQTRQTARKMDACSFLSSAAIQLIVTSPLQRAINTTFGILQNQSHAIQQNSIPVIAHHQLREWVGSLSDIGTPKSKLMQIYNGQQSPWPHRIEFSCIKDEVWWKLPHEDSNDDDSADINEEYCFSNETQQNVEERISAFKHWILQREEENILVVGHSRWFKQFVGASSKLNNCQMMKVVLRGMEVEHWEYIDFDKLSH